MSEACLITELLRRCTCCLNENNLRNIWMKQEGEGDHEIYGVMLNECFGITWQQTNLQELICEVCISRLRDAVSFKKEILASQEVLREGVGTAGVIDFNTKIKLEVDEATGAQSVVYEQVQYLDPEFADEETQPSSSKVSTNQPRTTKFPRKKIRSERNKTYKQYSRYDLKEAVQLIKEGKITCLDASGKYGIPKNTLSASISNSETKQGDEIKEANSDKHYKLIEEIRTLLTYTNAVLFRTRTSRYYCFYCNTDGPVFEDPEELRKHTQVEHFDNRIASLEQLMKPQWMHEVIKIDVEGLICIVCHILLTDWNGMFQHFASAHQLEFEEAYTRVIPYALTSDLRCVLCSERFHNYNHLDGHMNHHYSNYICYECGDTFLAASRLDKHLKIHKVGSYPCKLCDKVFSLEKYRSKHFSLVHIQDSVTKCLYCPAKFPGPLQRHAHVVEQHKEKVKTFTCEVCGQCFSWKPYFLAHMRKKHSTDKKYKCTHCPKEFLMQYELNNHFATHTGEKRYVCGVCFDSFLSMNTLRKHVKQHVLLEQTDT